MQICHCPFKNFKWLSISCRKQAELPKKALCDLLRAFFVNFISLHPLPPLYSPETPTPSIFSHMIFLWSQYPFNLEGPSYLHPHFFYWIRPHSLRFSKCHSHQKSHSDTVLQKPEWWVYIWKFLRV